MPSQRREVVTLGGSGTAAMNSTLLSHHRQNAKPFSYSSLLQAGSSYCTPQAHCRSESTTTTTTTTPLLLSSYPDMESWFPAAAASNLTDSASPAASQSNKLQRSSEEKSTSLGDTCVEEEVVSAAAAADAGQRLLSQFVGEYQGDAWWPSVGACAVGGKDQHNGLAQHGINNTKSSRTPSPFPSCTNTDSWPCNDDATAAAACNHPVAVANVDVDLNTPSGCELPSAIAVATVAPATAKGGSGRKAGPKQKGKSTSAPTSPSSLLHLGVQKRPVSQRENHIWSERQRRKGMNYLFSTLRGLLPHPTSKTDKSTVVGEIVKYIQSLQLKLDLLIRKRQHILATHTLTTFNNSSNNLTPPQSAFVSNGLTLVDHSNDPTCMTSVTALPLPGSESGLQSYLGSNVGLHVCGLNVFITASSPRGRRGLLQGLLVVVGKYCLEVVNANVSTSTASIFYCLHCQASPEAELLNNSLHSDLQSMITNFEAPF